ncbi:hypothetical protein HPP92_013059 [Vanilla planifolia]|uniref:Ras-associating domain-containing protein n=1 Tax=Vanilla planifolia TaxID=51239 RepID=A0A835QXX4_VANPL|nr:hypothetical protein HPP92_013528 [Vanilla planifolia]KAG0478340.1 hypothetical protein HPP92_013059 [Vanilla planifolia]
MEAPSSLQKRLHRTNEPWKTVEKWKEDKRDCGKMMMIGVKILGVSDHCTNRLLVQEDDTVAGVIRAVLDRHDRFHRFPALGKNAGDFHLCCVDACGSCGHALDPRESIGCAVSCGGSDLFALRRVAAPRPAEKGKRRKDVFFVRQLRSFSCFAHRS